MNSEMVGSSRLGLRVARRSPESNLEREECIYLNKYEKSLDNRSAALVSREGRAPRAVRKYKSLFPHALQLISLLIRARGAQVSRAARGPKSAVRKPANKRCRTVHRGDATSRMLQKRLHLVARRCMA